MRDQAEGQVFIDDLRRMFRVCRKDRRRSLLEDLQEYGDYLTDVRTGHRVSELSEIAELELLHWPTRKPFRVPGASKATTPPAARQTQTQPARVASAVARAAEADKRAMAIWSIREELVAQQGHVSYAEIAAEATRRGLHTAQGGAWRANNIGRALERAQGLLPRSGRRTSGDPSDAGKDRVHPAHSPSSWPRHALGHAGAHVWLAAYTGTTGDSGQRRSQPVTLLVSRCLEPQRQPNVPVTVQMLGPEPQMVRTNARLHLSADEFTAVPEALPSHLCFRTQVRTAATCVRRAGAAPEESRSLSIYKYL